MSEARHEVLRNVVENPEDADNRRGIDGPPRRLVIKAHVAADHGCPELFAGRSDSADALLKGVVHLRLFGVPEIKAIGHGDRRCARADDVSRGFSNGDGAAGEGIEIAEPPVAVCLDGDALVRSPDTHHAGIATGRNRRVVQHLLVVLAEHAPLAGDIGPRQQPQQDGGRFASGEVRQ